MASNTSPNRRGQRNPSMLGADVDIEMLEHEDPSNISSTEGPEPVTLSVGDMVTVSINVAVPGFNGMPPSYVGYKTTSRLQAGETEEDIQERVTVSVFNGIANVVGIMEEGNEDAEDETQNG